MNLFLTGGRFTTVFFFILLQLLFLAGVTTSRQIDLWPFRKYAHGVESGSITMLNTKQVLIRNFKYDGKGPAAWFQIKQRETPTSPNSNPKEYDDLTSNPKIPDEKRSCDIVKEYTGDGITLTLPANLTWFNIDYVALYCYEFKHNFGYINISPPESIRGLDEFPTTGKVPSFCTGTTTTTSTTTAAAGLNSSEFISATTNISLILVTMFSRFIT